MKLIFFARKKRNNIKKASPQGLLIFFCSLTCALSLSLICLDCENYDNRESSLPAVLTFTPPEKPKEMGFWDIITSSIANILSID